MIAESAVWMKLRRVASRASAMRARLRSPALRVPMLAGAATLFLGGAWYSFRKIAIAPSDLLWQPVATLGLLALPSLLYGGVGLVLLARTSGLSMQLRKATVISAYAYLAELLPIPGGAIVRTGALVKAGGRLKHSSLVVILTAVLWIALAMVGAGLTLLPLNWHLSVLPLLVGSCCTLAISLWLVKTAGVSVTVLTLVHRTAGIVLMAIRLQFAFAALHVSTGFTTTLPFVLASLLGSASSIAPAGMGLGEGLAALAATFVAFSPGAAFLAVGLDRIVSLLACAAVAAVARPTRAILNNRSHATT